MHLISGQNPVQVQAYTSSGDHALEFQNLIGISSMTMDKRD